VSELPELTRASVLYGVMAAQYMQYCTSYGPRCRMTVCIGMAVLWALCANTEALGAMPLPALSLPGLCLCLAV
jgi:hypothetical protein